MAEETQVLVKFVTKLPAHLKVPETPVAVPSTLKRYGLSQIINHLLALDYPRPFDFLVDGELVRRSLEQHLLGHNLSAESTLEVEYVPAVVPPQQKSSTPHDDWVSSVDASRATPASPASSSAAPGGTIVSGSYDGLLRLWNGELECTASVAAHAGGVNCARFLPRSQGDLLLSAGKDLTVKMWRVEGATGGGGGGGKASRSNPDCRLLATYRGHVDGVECVAPSPSGRRFASSGWDGRLLVWETGRPVAEAADAEAAEGGTGAAEGSKKKRRVGANGTAGSGSGSGGLSVSEPSTELTGHLHCISAVSWPAEDVLISGGWDHSVRCWDVSTGVATDTYNGSKAVLSLASHGSAPHLIAFGCADRALRLWDTRGRAGSDTLAVTTHGSHGNWVTAVAWCPSSQHHLATASHDGTVKLWDVRTQVSLGSLGAQTGKVLCVGWLGGSEGPARGLVSGGADCQLRMYESEGALAGL
uniref:Ribosome biogenesis protein WDR12 homolog n=1 Tax=Yamagishiella unicocca TaxID=51707 RepID=A0A1W6R6M5_9CHLO|nr:WD40 protein [Yamagishiella unicocca]